jgi:hypothetical protein
MIFSDERFNAMRMADNHWKYMCRKIFHLLLLSVFLAALIPGRPTVSQDSYDLRTAIVSVRHLDQVADAPGTDFAAAFSHTLHTFNKLAVLGISVKRGQNQENDDRHSLTIDTRISCLIPKSIWSIPEGCSNLPPDQFGFLYLSITPTPETPPPLTVRC